MSTIEPASREPVEIIPRVHPSALARVAVRERQGHKCAKCGSPFLYGRPTIEYDHILPLALGGSNDIANIEALCADPCHKAKTREDIARIRKAQRLERQADPETRRRSPRPLRSRGFSKDPLR